MVRCYQNRLTRAVDAVRHSGKTVNEVSRFLDHSSLAADDDVPAAPVRVAEASTYSRS